MPVVVSGKAASRLSRAQIRNRSLRWLSVRALGVEPDPCANLVLDAAVLSTTEFNKVVINQVEDSCQAGASESTVRKQNGHFVISVDHEAAVALDTRLLRRYGLLSGCLVLVQ
jgi:hypothetical protein